MISFPGAIKRRAGGRLRSGCRLPEYQTYAASDSSPASSGSPPASITPWFSPRRYNWDMATRVAELLREALDMPAEDRAALADSLMDSLDTQRDPDAEQRWRDEVALRVREIDSGSSELVGWDDAKGRLRRRLDD